MPGVILFNPRSANSKHRIPNSILQVAASIDGLYAYFFVDGNMETDPEQKIIDYIKQHAITCLGLTVMPGPQLKQAVPISKKVKELFPHVHIVWGGYFPSNQPKVVLESGYVDFIVNGPGDVCFPALLQKLEKQENDFETIPNLIFKREGQVVFTKKDGIYDQDTLPALPYKRLNETYPIKKYLAKTFLGSQTISYHSSFGCPFTCSFCAVVPIYNARWKGKSARNIYQDVLFLKEEYGGNAIEFMDNNFFVSEKRTIEFADLIEKHQMGWWGEGRIDTIDKYKDDSLKKMRDAGCKMIFLGAETGNDEILRQMDKGGTQSGAQIKKFAERMAKFDIIPEMSFVLGTPGATEKHVKKQIDEDIKFIKEVKSINPHTEIIIYVYSPVPTEGSELYEQVKSTGFKFPERLEDWINDTWANFDLRKNPLTPWLKPYMIDKIKNFETVLNGYYPTVSDLRMQNWKRQSIRLISSARYQLGTYQAPYEIKILQKLWKYRQPEIEGF